MPEHGGEDGDDLNVYQPYIVDIIVVFEHFDQRDRDESLEKVQQKDRQGGTASQHPQHIGRAGVLAAVFADVDAVVFLADPHGAGDRAEQIGDDYHRDNAIIGQYHLPCLSELYMQI